MIMLSSRGILVYIERELATAILALAKDGPVVKEEIKKKVSASSSLLDDLLQKMQNDGLLYLNAGFVETNRFQRLNLVLRALELGSDLENVSNLLGWQEFEIITGMALKSNGYDVVGNLRFTHRTRRWEIDVIGCKKPIAVCFDCKHWHHGTGLSALERIVEEQVLRTRALADAVPSPRIHVKCAAWKVIEFVPAIVSLPLPRFKFYDSVPVIPILQLQSFLLELPVQLSNIKHFTKKILPTVEL